MWYVMQVRTGTEENIRCQCQRLISSNVLERCFIPYYQQKKRFQGEWHIQERILFPGYVFLITQNPEKLVNGLKKVIGLTKLIGTGDEIVPLVQEEIDLLMKIGTDKQLVEMSSGIIENDRVQILAGPLMGMEGNIRRIDRHKRTAYLEIEMFGRTVEMKVGLEIIRKESRGWYKHKDFILIDLACLFMALILAYLIRNGSVRNLFTLGIYRNVMIFVILVDLFLIILFESYKGVLRRGRYQELRSVIRQMILIELASGLYLFTVSGGRTFSRIILYLMGIFYVLLSYCTRIIWKKRLLHKMAEGGEHSLYIVTNYDLASKVIQNVKEHNYNRYNINGLILIDKDMTGKEIAGVPVVADLNNAPSFICQQWVDEVFVNVDETYPYPQELIEELLEMGMPVHVNLAKVRSTPGQKQFVEAIGGYTVLTTTMNYATDRQALAKRVLDILGGLVGCFLTGIIFIFIAPAIYISSPGPIFFSQTRIGKNGKPFKMYKFRSMYMDAEERKAELMAQNKMSDGRMFKLDFDPRVIGNKILPDGTRKTGIGEFIRKTSLDEFPQFWNVLNGSMSLVGTRPILQDELRQYELHHRARIAIKPGITGMWQVSGRSDITDFEEVVRLDTEYISNWNFGLDIKILFKTVIMVLKREGSV